MADVMICAGCRKNLTQRDDGAYLRCCGKGYLTGLAPLPRDRWWPVIKVGGMYWYRSENG